MKTLDGRDGAFDRQPQRSRRNSGASKSRLRTWLQILKASRLIENELRERLRVEFATTLPRFDVMAALFRSEDGLRMGDLSEALMVSNGNITPLVDRLVKDGMVMRVPVAADRRASAVTLTADGRAQFAIMAAAHEGWVDELLSGLSAADAQQLSQLLRQVRDREE